MSRQTINFDKSGIFLSHVVGEDTREEISGIFRCYEAIEYGALSGAFFFNWEG